MNVAHRVEVVAAATLTVTALIVGCGPDTTGSRTNAPTASPTSAVANPLQASDGRHTDGASYPGVHIDTSIPTPTTTGAVPTVASPTTNPEGVLLYDDSTAFDVNECEPSDPSQTRLDIQQALSSLPDNSHIVVDGWVDSRGEPAAMEQLARCRANRLAAIATEVGPPITIDIVVHGIDDLRDPSCQGDCPQNRVATLTQVD